MTMEEKLRKDGWTEYPKPMHLEHSRNWTKQFNTSRLPESGINLNVYKWSFVKYEEYSLLMNAKSMGGFDIQISCRVNASDLDEKANELIRVLEGLSR